MAFKCPRYFVMFKKGPHHHISVCMTVRSESQMCEDHFTAGRESEIMHTNTQYTRMSIVSQQTVLLGSLIYSQRGDY